MWWRNVPGHVASETCLPSMTACCTVSRWGGAGRSGAERSQPLASTTTAVWAASAWVRNDSGRARTNLRSAARSSGVADDDGPATRNNARASAAESPLRSVRPPPANRQPPLRPCSE